MDRRAPKGCGHTRRGSVSAQAGRGSEVGAAAGADGHGRPRWGHTLARTGRCAPGAATARAAQGSICICMVDSTDEHSGGRR
eukprot:533688-Pleurochrysis_carterae.AAC.1